MSAWNYRFAWLLILLTGTLSYAHEGHQPLPSKGVLVDLDRGYVTLTDQARNTIGLKSVEVSMGEVSSRLFAYAEAVAPWGAKAFASPQISGHVTKLLVRPGERVEKGQVVAELTSRELETLQLEYMQARKDLELNKKLLDLIRPSASAGAVPRQRVFELENAYEQSESSLAIASLRARTLGIELAELDRPDHSPLRYLVRSPIAGTIIHADVAEGKFVESLEHLFEVVNNDQTWVRLQLLEKDLFHVEVGQSVELEFVDAGVRLSGTIDRMDAELDAVTQVSWAWVTVSHPAIVPGLVGNGVIHTASQKERLTVPRRAVYSDGLQNYVFVEEASTQASAEYRKQNVVLGKRQLKVGSQSSGISADEERLEIVQGDIYPGDSVVVQGGHELSSLFFLGVLKLNKRDRDQLGIRTVAAVERPISEGIPIAANVALPPESRYMATSRTAGTIHSHSLTPGKTVRKGELLMEIASHDFYALQLDLLRSSLDANLARQRANRLEIAKEDAFSHRLYLETITRAEQFEGRTENLKRQIVSLGLSAEEVEAIVRERQIRDYLPIIAPIDGRVTAWAGTLGETVTANQALFEIQNLDHLWIEALVPTKSMHEVNLESAGQAAVLSNPSVSFPVQVTRVGPIVSETTRTQSVWLAIGPDAKSQPATPSGRDVFHSLPSLRDGMRLTVLLKSLDGPAGVCVPNSAVLRDGMHSYLFVQKPDDYIERRRVMTGRSDGEFTEITSGIQAGEAVVSAGGRELQTAFASLR